MLIRTNGNAENFMLITVHFMLIRTNGNAEYFMLIRTNGNVEALIEILT